MSATQPLTLPDEALARFREVLGADAVLVEEPDRDEYRDPYWFKDDRTYDSSVVLLPSSTEEVQALVRIANELGVALWTSSRGKNLGYGGPSPRVRGSAVVSLVRMNRVIEINPELAYAVVEPGVRWFDLHAALQEAGHDDLLVTIPDLGWGSVVGNSLDNGITYMPYGQDFMAPCGMEVVLADGELVRTGMGAMPDNKTWHLYKRGLGPVLDPLFIQSNYGIVTRMGYWLMRRPEAFAPLFLTVPRDDQLAQAIDILRELRLDGTIRGVPSMYSTLTLAAQFPEIMGEFVADGGVLADEQIQEIADRTGLGRWGMRAAIWGDAPVAEHHVEKVKRAWSAIDGAKVIHERTFTKDDWDEIAATPDKIHAGIPNLDLMDAIPPERRAPRVLAGRAARRLRRARRRGLHDRAHHAARRRELHRRHPRHQRAQLRDRHRGELRRHERGGDQEGLRDGEDARRGVGAPRLRRVPRAPGLHGPRERPVLLQRPRVPALLRAHQGRGRPQRHPLPRPARHLAGGHARR